jgi:hypothetical protein
MTSEEARDAAQRALEEAKHLAGLKTMSDLDFLSSMARGDELNDHDIETCGLCCRQYINAEVAREMIAAGQWENGTQVWAEESWRRWQESKFFKLWQEEQTAGRDPHQAFAERGWEP